MKYTNCPTCGGLAKYVSSNFEEAKVLINQENEQFKHELRAISKQLEEACEALKKKVEHLDSYQLFYLYRTKLQQELIKEQVVIDKAYFKIDEEAKRLSEMFKKGLDDMNKRMLGL